MTALPWNACLVVRGAGLAVLLALAGCRSELSVLTANLTDPDPEVRETAARDLGELGPAARPAALALVAATLDEQREVRQAACRALGELGTTEGGVIGGLKSALEDKEMSVRTAAAFSLLKLNPADQAYVPALEATMREGEGGTIVAVGKLGPSAAWALPTLISLLQDGRPGIRRLAAEAIGRIGPNVEARVALQKIADDRDDRVRAAVQTALQAS